MFLLVVLFIAASAVLLSMALLPMFVDLAQRWKLKKETKISHELDNLFYDKSPKNLMKLYFILPPVLGIVGFVLFRSLLLAAAGTFIGLFVPNLIMRLREGKRRQMFSSQILDTIMILSSALKGGLSLLQALEVIVEEMPIPMNQEVGLAVRENKMGITLEESLNRLKVRMHMDDLTLVVNSILVARETGGDLTKVLSRLSTTIRDNRKLKDSIKTLTMQGKLQGIIMSFLPFVFVWWVITFNRHHFDIMLQNDTGRFLLVLAVILQVIGMFLIKKFSTINL